MAFSKKKSRPITIENKKYRWIVTTREKGIVAFIAERQLIIKQALRIGWNPETKGKPNRYTFNGLNLRKTS